HIAAPAEKKSRGRRSAKALAQAETAAAALKERLFDLRKKGYGRLFQNGQIFEFSTPESLLDIDFTKPLYVLADRIVVAPDQRTRIVDAVETGYREAGATVFESAPREGEQPQQWRF